MSVESNGKLNILQRSPLDRKAAEPEGAGVNGKRVRWVPSRFNVHSTTGDGKLVVWNTHRGSMSVFEPEQVPMVKPLLRKGAFEAEAAGIVEYLSRRGFLVEEDTDEYASYQLSFGQQHYRTDLMQLTLMSSEDCNFRCKYCYETFQRGTMKPWVREGVRKLVERRAKSLRRLVISWFGGEPLYGFEAIEELAPFFREITEEHSIGYTGHMTTNGYLLEPEVSKKLLAWGITDYQITIDGPRESHDKSRPTRTGAPSFDKIVSNLEAMSRMDERFTVSIRVNFDWENEPKLGGLLDVLEERLGTDQRFRLRFRSVGRWGGSNDHNLDICGVEEGNRLRHVWEARARERGFATADDLNRNNRLGSQACYAARPYNFVIGAEGAVMKCTVALDSQEKNVVGQIGADGTLKLDHARLALWTEPPFESREKCRKCVLLPVCQGCACPLSRLSNNSMCPPLRKNMKHQMKAIECAFGQGAQKVTVEGSPAIHAAAEESPSSEGMRSVAGA